MESLPPESASLTFEPDSVYVVFVMREGQPRVGVFHHSGENKGKLAFADVKLPELRRSHCKIVSLELRNSKARFSNHTCVSLTFAALRDRNRVYHRHRAQSGKSALPRVVT